MRWATFALVTASTWVACFAAKSMRAGANSRNGLDHAGEVHDQRRALGGRLHQRHGRRHHDDPRALDAEDALDLVARAARRRDERGAVFDGPT